MHRRVLGCLGVPITPLSDCSCCLYMQLKKLVIDLGSLAEGYKTAGQFVQIKVGDSKAGFFAIASPPDTNNQGLVEVLIKDGPPDSTANLLCNISAGIDSLID